MFLRLDVEALKMLPDLGVEEINRRQGADMSLSLILTLLYLSRLDMPIMILREKIYSFKDYSYCQLAKLMIVWGIHLYDTPLRPVCYKRTYTHVFLVGGGL